MQTPIPRAEVQDSDSGAFQEATAKLDSAWPLPSIRDQRVIHWLGMPWFVTYKGPYIDQVSINGHWLNADYVFGRQFLNDLEVRHAMAKVDAA